MKVNAQACPAAKAKLQPHSFELVELGPKDVEIAVTHCGICHSDVHMMDNDWGIAKYPLIPGHEIVGTVAKLGSQVEHLKMGDRVGVGWVSGSCLECEWCSQEEETSCYKLKETIVGRPGGFAERTIVDSRWAFKLPDALESAGTAPLLCGGITVYAPLVENADSRSKVGIIGIGGLGHMALKFARAMGCEVTAFSTSENKAKEAETMGAHHFVNSRDAKQMNQAIGSLDLIVSTINVDQDWEAWMKVLRPKGELVLVGASPGTLNINAATILMGKKSVKGSVTGGRARIREMLAFAARHGIHAQTEIAPLGEANAAVDKVRSNQARYRMVLKIA